MNTFGTLFKNVADAEDGLLLAQYQYDADPSPDNFQRLQEAKDALVQVHLQEEVEAKISSTMGRS